MTEPPQNSNTGKSSAKQSRRISQNSPSLVVHDVTCEGHSPFSVASRSRATTNASAGCREIALGSSILSISPGVQITSSSDNGVAPSSNTQHGSGSVPPPPQQNEVRPSPSSIFSRTIQDLEGLLNEALTIARDAAEDHEVNCRVHLPELVGEPAQAQSEAQTSRETNAAHNAEQTLAQVSVPRSPRVPSGQAVNQQHLHKLDSVQTHGQANDNGQRRKSTVPKAQPSYVLEQDFAQPFRRQTSLQLKEQPSQLKAPSRASVNLKEPQGHTLRRKASEEETPPQNEARRTAKRHGPPPIHPRSVSKQRKRAQRSEANVTADREIFKNSAFDEPPNDLPKIPSPDSDVYTSELFRRMFGVDSRHNSSQSSPEKHSKHIDLNGCRHVDIKGSEHVNVHDSRRRQPVARDWAISRKQFAATTACINTALIGIIIGIYAGEVPAIQYVIVDLDHHIILGNVFFYIGLAIPTLFLWPLPLMHGRKPYIVMALALALGLQIPQGIAVSDFRSPQDPAYRKLLLLSRAISGFALGFVQINLQATLLDLFGASLQSGNPHQEVVDPYDVRRHGGGMGLWLGLWSGCSVGSISVGFFIGTLMVQIADVTWGFWITLILMMVVLLLNVIAPEVRRSAYRRTVAELLGEEGCISRVSRGEIKMHLRAAGPYWWGEEVKAGMELCWKMFRQGGFVILAVYTAWVYAHFTLILMVCSPDNQTFKSDWYCSCWEH